MQDHNKETLEKRDGEKVYEIGYLFVPSIPIEKITDITTSLREIISSKSAIMIAEEAPELRELAYTMVKKIGSLNHTFNKGYFGWFKFELSSNEIEEVKKSFEINPNILRILLITTIRENTYLGKKIPGSAPITTSSDISSIGNLETETLPIPGLDVKIPKAQSSIDEMDKSIDDMVKGA